jgi:hypothetical protein
VIRLVVALAVIALAATAAAAAPRKVLVLPLDGTADPAVRARFDLEIKRLAKSIDGTVTPGTTTFAETATAVGCDPHTAACVDDVIATLGVDELVWGIATTRRGKTDVVVRRAVKQRAGAPRVPTSEATATVDADTPVERAAGQLNPLFGLPPDPAIAAAVTTPEETTAPGVTGSDSSSNHHTIALAMTAGGGFLVLVGLILWANESSIQGDIDGHPTRTVADFQDLQSLEDRASGYAITGDLLVLGGLVLGGYGGWQLYKDHQQSVTIHPAPMPGGAGVVLEWRGLP